MTVARILARKGREVATVPPHASLRDVVDVLAAKHIGALVIVDIKGAMLGIVSERDVVRALAKQGADVLDDPVSRHMTKSVVAADESDSVIAIAQKMSNGRFRHMPVIADGRLVGMISTGDAVKYRLEEMEAEQSALREYIATA